MLIMTSKLAQSEGTCKKMLLRFDMDKIRAHSDLDAVLNCFGVSTVEGVEIDCFLVEVHGSFNKSS